MRHSIAALCLALAACASAGPAGEAPTAASAHITAALADARRPEADRARDAARHPAELMAFAQVQPGQRILDFGPGGGYFTRLYSVAVGEGGRVYALIRPPAPNRPPAAIHAVAAQYGNIVVSAQDWSNWSPPEPVDAIWMSQEYHDLYLPRLNIDAAAANRAIFNAVKPGGILVIVDHSALPGTDLSAPDTLHRIDQAIARRELEAAGWVFEAETDVLRNPEDARTINVFDAAIRGRTDQFAMRFRKPR
jgi:predicted methyltransferase